MEFFDNVIKALCDLDKTHNWDDLVDEEENVEEIPLPAPLPLVGSEAPNPAPPSSEDAPKTDGKVFHRNRMANLEISVERLEGMHYPSLLPTQKRRRCVFHPSSKQRYYCETCDVALCLAECGEESCWFKFHHSGAWKKK
jgi:hypothetical protein